jgi:hypothetical protein
MTMQGIEAYLYCSNSCDSNSLLSILLDAMTVEKAPILGPLCIQPQAGKIERRAVSGVYSGFGALLVWGVDTPGAEQASVLLGEPGAPAKDFKGQMSRMMSTTSIVSSASMPSYALSYGFYEAWTAPDTGLTSCDRLYVYLTPSQSTWMGELVRQNPNVGSAPFACFALPGAHDAGTFDLSTVNALTKDVDALASFLEILGKALPPREWLAAILLEVASGLLDSAASKAVQLVTGLAVTQKDDITTMLNLGCRYFDFRPGYAPDAIPMFAPDIYHIHTVVPGYEFDRFLSDVVTWLAKHPTEIVVVGLATSGFLTTDMIPDASVTQAAVNAAISASGNGTVVAGAAADLASTYNSLIFSNKRLIFLNSGTIGWSTANKYDSYSDQAYATTTPPTVIRALQAMNKTGQSGNDFTVLQTQATATGGQNTGPIVLALLAAAGQASYPLMSTKALFDSAIYPLLPRIAENLKPDQLLVLLNDFFDNQATDVAQALTLQRAAENAAQGTATPASR